MTPIVFLHAQVKAIAPTMQGVSIGRWDDKQTWRVTGPVSRAEQDAAQVIFQAFDKAAYEASLPPIRTRAEKLAAIEAANTVAQLREAIKELL